jgi:hypothetical protein
VTHPLLRDADDLAIIMLEGYALDGGGEFPDVETLPGRDVPEAQLVVGGTRDEKAGLSWGVCWLVNVG